MDELFQILALRGKLRYNHICVKLSLKNKRVIARLFRTRFSVFLRESHGDWQYPFIVMGWLLSSLFVPRRKVSCDSVNFSLSCTNPITHFRWYLFARKEQEVRQYINDFVKDGDVFFDVGANVGVFSIYCASRYPKTAVYSFEPEYSNLGILKDNVIANQLTGQIKITSVAVSDFGGLSYLNVQDLSPGAAAATEHSSELVTTEEGYKVVWQEGIACATLDALASHHNVAPNALKIDTDGNEDRVLRGASRVIANPALRSVTLEMPMKPDKIAFCELTLKQAGFVLNWARPTTRNQIWIRKP